MMNQPKQIANRYQVQDLIGRGGMGDVYRAFDQQSQEVVAIKALKPLLEDTGDVLERFVREGEALRQLNHPNIVKMLATIEENGRHYIVMEYVSGGSLRELLDVMPQLPISRVLSIALELCDALTRAHHLKIIHRDLKPANVLLAEDGTPRLTDFGVAFMGNRTRITADGILTGTYAYLSPELCSGEPLDTGTDIWALGVMMFEMLAGQKPFDGEHAPAILMAIVNKPVPDLQLLRLDVPVPLADLIYRMLAKRREQRPPSIRLVGAELEAMLEALSHMVPLDNIAVLSPTKTTGAALPVRHNLPPENTAFVGRTKELAEVRERLLNESCRLLTILGPGGIGKTRLALQTATQLLSHFADGVYFIPLVAVTSTDFLVATIAEHINYSFYQGNLPADPRHNTRAQLLNYLSGKQMLFVMDNVELLLSGADLIADILQRAPNVKILATSRERLNLQTEWVFLLEGMTIPMNNDITVDEYSAIKLFIQSAQRVNGGFTLNASNRTAVAHICRLVQGMPLAIELAAAWMQMLSPSEVAQEIESNLDFLETPLRDVPERHRSLRAVFEYSWNSLRPNEREALQKLTVFRGGFQREAATKVANASLPILSALVNKSILRRITLNEEKSLVRYELHEILRQYTSEKLGEAPEAAIQTRNTHCTYYAAFLQKKEAACATKDRYIALQEIETEIENIQAAWKWALTHRKEAEITQLQSGLVTFFRLNNWFEEGKETFRQALTLLGTAVSPSLERIQAQLRVSYAKFNLNLPDQGEDLSGILYESLAFFQRTQAASDEAFTLYCLARLAGRNLQFEDAKTFIQQSLTIYQQINDPRGIANTLAYLGRLENEQGNYITSQTLYKQSLALYRRLEDVFETASILEILGLLAYRLGDYEATERFAQESVALYKMVGHDFGIAHVGRLLAVAASMRGDHVEAMRVSRESLAMHQKIGNRWGEAVLRSNLAYTYYLLNDLPAALESAQKSLAVFQETNNRSGLILPLGHLGRILSKMGQYNQAKHYLFEALVIIQEMGAVPLMLETLVGLAEIWRAEGYKAQALMFLSFVSQHPALIRESQERVQAEIETLQKELQPEQVEEALNNGRYLQLEEVTRDLIVSGRI